MRAAALRPGQVWRRDPAKLPFVTTYHGAYKGSNGLKRWYNSVMARGDRVIANSQFTADSIIAQYPFARDRLTVIPRGTDLRAVRWQRPAL
jgi:hypothetical protein